jgi:hypothetical protein
VLFLFNAKVIGYCLLFTLCHITFNDLNVFFVYRWQGRFRIDASFDRRTDREDDEPRGLQGSVRKTIEGHQRGNQAQTVRQPTGKTLSIES